MALSKNERLMYEYYVLCQQNDLKELVFKRKMFNEWTISPGMERSDSEMLKFILKTISSLEGRMQNRAISIKMYQDKR